MKRASASERRPAAGPRRVTPALRRLPRAARLAAGLGAVALVLSSCLSTGYAYESHRSPDGTNLYFKVPSRWTFYDAKQVVESQNGPLGQSQINQITSGQWVESVSGSPHPTVRESLKLGTDYPTGVIEGRELSVTERDGLNYSAMRSELLGIDPLNTQNGLVTRSGFQMISYDEFTGPNGIRGVKMVLNIIQKGSPVHTFGQVTAVDKNTDWIFAIGIGCTASCWGTNSGLIDQVLNSWTLKEST